MLKTAPKKTVLDALGQHAAKQPNARAMLFEGRTTTYGELDRNTNKVANALLTMGLKPGDHIAFIGKNSDSYFEMMFGAMKAGMIVTPVNWRLAPPEMVYIVNNAEAPALFVGPEFSTVVHDLLPKLTTVKHVVAMEQADGNWPAYAAWRDAQPPSAPAVEIDNDRVAIQLYTSGTTGHPKGAMLSHGNLVNLAGEAYDTLPEWNQWTTDDASLVAMPVFHIAGTGWGLLGLYHGAKNVILRDFDPNAVLDMFQTQGISKAILVPAAMQFVVRHPRARQIDYSRLKYMIYGASPCPLDLLKECMEVFGCGFVQMYGMTETTGAITILDPEDHVPEGSTRMRSAGRAMAGVEMAILDTDGNKLSVGQTGEIASRSASNMVGYWKMPEATKATIDADNWLRTGDAGYIDEDGYIYVQDRIKDMIISGGENIYPAEVENAVFGHPGVADVAVIGVPDDKWGESVKAIVVRRPDAQVTSDEIIAWARQQIAGYKAPRSVEFIDALPRNPSGKILRRELREPYWKDRERRVN